MAYLDRAFTALKETIRLKSVNGSKIRILAGFIVMKYNEHKVGILKKDMAKLGVDDVTIINPGVRDLEQGKNYLPEDKSYWSYDIEAFENNILKPNIQPNKRCDWIYYSLATHMNRDIIPCCRDPKGEQVMRNLLNQGLDEIWNGEPYITFREQIIKDQKQVEIYKLCSSYPASQTHWGLAPPKVIKFSSS